MAESQTNGDAAVEERRKALGKLKRDEVDAEAKRVGIEDPGALDNADQVVDAIIEHEEKLAAERAAEEEAENPRYSREELLASARQLTGQRRHIVAGALAGTKRTSFTAAAAKKLVTDFMGKKDTTRQSEEEE